MDALKGKITLTSQEFRKHNEVIFEGKILNQKEAKPGTWPVRPTLFEDVIDINCNNKIDTHVSTNKPDPAVVVADVISGEPSLKATYKSVKKVANEIGKEVVTQDDIKDFGVSWNFSRWTYNGWSNVYKGSGAQSVKKEMSIEDFMYDLTAQMQDAVGVKWAFDCNKNSFIIYKPKE
jgi:hypothetical protein